MWTWPEYGYCESVPTCLSCPILALCGPQIFGEIKDCRWAGSPSLVFHALYPLSYSCNGLVNKHGQGQCQTKYNGRHFCYVNDDVSCNKIKSTRGLGYYSYEACDIVM